MLGCSSLRQHARLLDEARLELLVDRQLGRQDLDRHLLLGHAVARHDRRRSCRRRPSTALSSKSSTRLPISRSGPSSCLSPIRLAKIALALSPTLSYI